MTHIELNRQKQLQFDMGNPLDPMLNIDSLVKRYC